MLITCCQYQVSEQCNRLGSSHFLSVLIVASTIFQRACDKVCPQTQAVPDRNPYPTEHVIFVLSRNPSIDVSEQKKVRQCPGFEALELWNVWSATPRASNLIWVRVSMIYIYIQKSIRTLPTMEETTQLKVWNERPYVRKSLSYPWPTPWEPYCTVYVFCKLAKTSVIDPVILHLNATNTKIFLFIFACSGALFPGLRLGWTDIYGKSWCFCFLQLRGLSGMSVVHHAWTSKQQANAWGHHGKEEEGNLIWSIVN